MTALKEFDRLESGGLWRDSPDGQRRDATVSFGKASLVVSDSAGRALSHWSLAAVIRLNPGERPALFAPDAEASETLEIEDDLMVAAIEKVRKSLLRTRPRNRRLRHLTTALILAAVAGGAVLWGPGVLTGQTLAVVPLFKRSEIGATILGHYQRLTGPTCRGALGTQALDRLRVRLMGPQAAGQIVVVQRLPQGAQALPGGIVLLDRALVEQHDDPAVAAGYVLVATDSRRQTDPLRPILSTAGLRGTLQLLTTGDLPPGVLADHARTLTLGTLSGGLDPDILAVFDAAQVPVTPYARARGQDDPLAQALITADPMTDRSGPPLLSDRDWVSLQGICTT